MSAPKQNIMRTKKMWELTWPEVKEAADSGMGVMLPIGAIEQHGYHLPLITDTILPVKLCLDIAEHLIRHLFKTPERRRPGFRRDYIHKRRDPGISDRGYFKRIYPAWI